MPYINNLETKNNISFGLTNWKTLTLTHATFKIKRRKIKVSSFEFLSLRPRIQRLPTQLKKKKINK